MEICGPYFSPVVILERIQYVTRKQEVGDLTELALHVSDYTEFPGP